MTTQSFTTDNLKELLAFPFQDDDWKNKFLIGSLIVIAGFAIPVIPFFFLYGYMMQIMHHIIVEKGKPFLPKWDDWGKLFVDGAKLVGVVLIYMLPIMVLMTIGFFIMFFLPMLGIPVAIIGGEENPEAAGAMMGILSIVSMVAFFVVFGIGMIISLAIGVVMPTVMGHVAATGDFGAAFRLKEWWAIFKANVAGFLLAYLIVFAVSMVLNSILGFLYCTIILCCIVPFLTAPVTLYTVIISGALFGEAYREGAEKVGLKFIDTPTSDSNQLEG
jgi:hypothetical protein